MSRATGLARKMVLESVVQRPYNGMEHAWRQQMPPSRTKDPFNHNWVHDLFALDVDESLALWKAFTTKAKLDSEQVAGLAKWISNERWLTEWPSAPQFNLFCAILTAFSGHLYPYVVTEEP